MKDSFITEYEKILKYNVIRSDCKKKKNCLNIAKPAMSTCDLFIYTDFT